MATAESILFSRIRGKLGDLVFWQNWNNAISLRSYNGSPAYPNSTGQQYVQTALTWASAQWATLSQALRDQWELYAQTVETRKPFGRSALTGRTAFIQVFSLARFLYLRFGYYSGLSFTPPSKTGFLPSVFVEAIPYTGPPPAGIQLKYTNFSSEDIRSYRVRSDVYSIARNRIEGPFNYSSGGSGIISANSSSTVNINLSAGDIGKVVFYRNSFISRYEPLRLGLKQVTRHVITAP